MARREELTDEQWTLIEPLFDKPPVVATRGRPRRGEREVLNGVLWILRSGARWADLPDRFPPYQTCHRRFQQWVKDGRLRKILETIAQDLLERGKLDLSETFIDGTFVSAKKGALKWERPSGAKARNSWQWQMALVFLSPFTQKVLRHTKSNWSSEPSAKDLPMNDRKR
jgi:transposase